LLAQKDHAFKQILNDCDLRVADGAGIWFAFWRFGKRLRNRFTGIDLMQAVLQMAAKNKYGIFLVSYRGALSSWEETRDAILQKYPNLEIGGVNIDMEISNDLISEKFENSAFDNSIFSKNSKLKIQNYEIVLCALGAPYQEKFIHSLKSSKNDKIRLAIGVGGSFDFLTKKIKRAPKYMRKVGLEWLWRFAQEPKYRAKRIFKAVVVFPVRILLNK
jgi:N-acetylglucosaminyldiphosphoundecaprenol N-acetyl-beta-D-mannosaminyltransferase